MLFPTELQLDPKLLLSKHHENQRMKLTHIESSSHLIKQTRLHTRGADAGAAFNLDEWVRHGFLLIMAEDKTGSVIAPPLWLSFLQVV